MDLTSLSRALSVPAHVAISVTFPAAEVERLDLVKASQLSERLVLIHQIISSLIRATGEEGDGSCARTNTTKFKSERRFFDGARVLKGGSRHAGDGGRGYAQGWALLALCKPRSPQGKAALEEERRECDPLLSAISVISLGSSFLMDFLIFVCQVM